MANKDKSEVDERLMNLEVDLSALKDRITLIAQTINDLRAGAKAMGFLDPTFPNQTIIQAFPLSIPLLFAPKTFPFTYPVQRINGPCATTTANIAIPGQGNYILTVNVPGESDCSVIVNDPAGLAAIGPVAPGSSVSVPFAFFSPTLIAKCQGSGNCIAELTLVQLS